MLEELGLGVHLVERQAEAIDEVTLEQAVVPQHLERVRAARVREGDASIRKSLDQPQLVEALGHRRRRGRADVHAAGERGRRDPLARRLERVDRLQVVLDGNAEIGGR